MNKGEKYNLILEAGIRTFLEKGFANTSVADIVKAANLAKGTFYLYFESKSALIPAMAEFLMEETLGSIKRALEDKSPPPLADIIGCMLDETFKITAKYKRIIVLCYAGVAFDHSFEKWELIYKPYYEWFQNVLEFEQAQQHLADPIDLKQSSIMIVNLIDQAAERYYLADEPSDSLETRKKEVAQFVFRAIGYTVRE